MNLDYFITINALLKKELRELFYRKRSVLMLGLFVAVAIGLVVRAWPENIPLVQMGVKSRGFLLLCFYMLLFAAGLYVPGMSSGSIVGEKERNTFDLLFTSLVSPRQIVIGKILSTVLFYLVLIISVLPVLASIFFLVGVDWMQFFQGFMLVFLAAISCSVAGVLASTASRRSYTSIILAYAGGLWGIGVLPCICTLWSPVWALQAIGSVEGESIAIFLYSFTFQLIICAVLCHMAAKNLGKEISLQSPYEDIRTTKETRKPRSRSEGFSLFRYLEPDMINLPFNLSSNAVLTRELRFELRRITPWIIIITVQYFLFNILLGIAAASDKTGAAVGWLYGVDIVFLLLFIPALVGNCVPKEYELENKDLLRMTLMSKKEMFWGKFMAVMIPISYPLVVTLVGAFPGLVSMRLVPAHLAGLLLTLVAVLFAAGLTFFLSIVLKKTILAVVSSYLILFCVFFFYKIADQVLRYMAGLPHQIRETTLFVGGLLSPVGLYFQTVADGSGKVIFANWLFLCGFCIQTVIVITLFRLAYKHFDLQDKTKTGRP